MSLKSLLEQADRGPWWFDGRDIFHTKPGTNLDQIIIPIPSAAETFLPEQGVLFATGKLAALAPDMARLLIDWDPLIEWLAHGMCLEPDEDGRSTCEGECVTCKARSSHPRFAELDGQAKDTT